MTHMTHTAHTARAARHPPSHMFPSHNPGPPPLHHTTNPNHPDNAQWFVTNDPANATAQAAFRNHLVIPPPENREAIDRCKTTFVVVDSASRNQSEFPEPNDYSMPLPNEIRDVKSLQLVSYKIPRPQFPVRTTNNTLHFTNAAVTVTPEVGGTYAVDEHKETSLATVSVSVGHYDAALTTHASTNPVVVAYRDEIVANRGGTALQQDALAIAIEDALNATAASTYVVSIDPVSEQYTVATNFANPAGSADDCNNPVFFRLFFQGCEEYYNGATTDKVRVPVTRTTREVNGQVICDPPPKCPEYRTCTYGKTHFQYPESSLGPIVGHPRTDPKTQLCGVVRNTDDPNTLTGVGTRFASQLQKGDWLYVVERDTGNHYRVHVSDTPLHDGEVAIDCDGAGGGTPPTFGDAFVWSGRTAMPWARNLQPDGYLSMFVNCAKTLQSFTTAIDGAFYLVPGIPREFYDIPEYLPFKTFSPILGRLDKLDITFKNPDNTLYDFKGRNHILLFKVEHYRQNVRYGDF